MQFVKPNNLLAFWKNNTCFSLFICSRKQIEDVFSNFSLKIGLDILWDIEVTAHQILIEW